MTSTRQNIGLSFLLLLIPGAAHSQTNLTGTWKPYACECSGGRALSLSDCNGRLDALLKIDMDSSSRGTFEWTWTVYTQAFGECDVEYGGDLSVTDRTLNFGASAARCINKNDGNSEGVPPGSVNYSYSNEILTFTEDRTDLCGATESLLTKLSR